MPSPMQRYNLSLIEQVDARLRQGFEASSRANGYCVIRVGVDNVLSVMSQAMVNDQQDAVFGPASFAKCIEYVNANFTARTATHPTVARDKQGNHHADLEL